MNPIVNKLLIAREIFMPEMHLKQPVFTYSACAPFTKNMEKIKKFKETWSFRYIYRNILNKACFQHCLVYGDFKDLNRRTAADKVSHYKAFNIAKIKNMMDINLDLLQWCNEKINLQKLTEKLHKHLLQIHSSCIDNILDADLADMQLTRDLTKDLDFY